MTPMKLSATGRATLTLASTREDRLVPPPTLPVAAGSPRLEQPRGEALQAPEVVPAMCRLHELGWGTRRIARELGCSRTTVQHYLSQGE